MAFERALGGFVARYVSHLQPMAGLSNMSSSVQIMEALNRSSFTRQHLAFYLTIVFCHFFDGFDIQMMGFTLPGIVGEFKLTPGQAGFLASSVFSGMLLGGIVVGTLADSIGRKNALLFAIVTYGLMGLCAGFAPTYESLVTIRVVQGFGLGAEVPLVFTCLSEFLPARRRGVLIASIVAFWQASSFAAALLAIYVIPIYTWRGMFWIAAVPVAILLIFILRMPESIRFLLLRGRIAEAETIARRFSDVDPSGIQVEATGHAEPHARLRALASAGYLRTTAALWLMQFCGGATFIGMLVWLPSIFVKMGFSLVRSFAYTAAITAAGALGNVVGGGLLDRVGRRPTLGGAFIIGSVLMLAWGYAATDAALLALGCATTFFAFGAAGGPLFAYTSEVYPNRFRATGTGWAAAWQRVGGIVAPLALGYILANGAGNFQFFAVLSATLLVGGLAMLLLGYETRGRSLEQIQSDLSARSV
jgi:MFS transporter, putative metabolite:H+ symporter